MKITSMGIIIIYERITNNLNILQIEIEILKGSSMHEKCYDFVNYSKSVIM